MRRIARLPLSRSARDYLAQRQAHVATKRSTGILRAADEWNAARKSGKMKSVLATLRRMAGDRERCMYCLDSHGADIEHFWPKTPYPEKMYSWPNLLLCCTECGRFKGDTFPLADGQPLLVDPTEENPWSYLDFDPDTGNLVARFDLDADRWSEKGLKTVEVLRLDRREALAAGYIRTYRRLARVVAGYLNTGATESSELPATLLEADDHGLLGWCLSGSGSNLFPFRDLKENQPDIWSACLAVMEF